MRKLFAAVSGLAVLLVGCQSTPPVAAGQTLAPTLTVASDLDEYSAADLAFYAALRPTGAVLARPPADLRTAAGNATVVVVAQVAEIRPQRVIGDLQTIGLHLKVTEVLTGALRPGLASLVVEAPLGGPGTVDRDVERLRARMPQASSVWFLRWQGARAPLTKQGVPDTDPADPTLYGLLHVHSLFLQGPDRVVNGLGEHRDDGQPFPGVQADGERFTKLSQLAAYLRTVG